MAPDWRHDEADVAFAREAVATIEAHADDDRPLFLFLASDAPHEPCVDEVVPAFARGKSRAGPRGDLVWLFDWMVGEVVDALERCGMADNTLLLVTSDNGALPGDRVGEGLEMASYHTYGHRSNGDWRGYKAHIWEGGHREPLIAHWPGVIESGRTNSDMVGLTDLLATCASLHGIELGADEGEDSADLLPILLDTPDRTPPRDHLIHHSQRGAFSIRRKAPRPRRTRAALRPRSVAGRGRQPVARTAGGGGGAERAARTLSARGAEHRALAGPAKADLRRERPSGGRSTPASTPPATVAAAPGARSAPGRR
jgi:hypothetical protein